MKITIGMQLCGFTVKSVRAVGELNAELIEMTHDKTNAQLCWMNNLAENKLFSVAFKTLPEDSTGVFHILEHSVLCGSEQYPVKEPFVELLKSSMNTYLNAMTYPDKTVYPVSSCNTQDFLNLTSVYLDAVFAPALTKNPNVFYQEGIHTELEEGKPSYKGVVFNEMKGAMSGVNDRIEHGMNQLLFPNNCYRFNSGGDPAVIPDLTYAQYVKTYRKFYHPSNARFFLDGDIPLEETLAMIDGYLEKYEKRQEEFEIPMQVPVANEGTAYYEITEEQNSEKKAVFALGKIIGTWQDREDLLAAKVLCEVLADSNESPLKRAILSSGLADDVEMDVIDGTAQPYLMIVVRNMADSDSDKIRQIIRDTVKQLINQGLDKKSILASINRLSFRSRQIPEPQGLYRALASYSSWLYGGDPLLYLLYDEAMDKLRQMAENGDFERLLCKLMGEEEGVCVLHMLPSDTLGAEERQAEESRLQKEFSALTAEQVKELVGLNETLSLWQQTPDAPEAAATLPTLPLSCVRDLPELVKTVETSENGVTLLYHPVQTNGIVYLSMYFPLTDFSLVELTKLSIFPDLFGELPTEKHTVTELRQEIKNNIGRLSFGLGVLGQDYQPGSCTPCLVVRAGILEENLPAAKSLLVEILTQTRFDDPDKIKEIVMQSDEMWRQGTIESGHSLAMMAVWAHYTAKGAVNEATSGYTAIKYLHNLAKNFDTMIEEFLSLVQRVRTEAVCKAGLTVSVTATKEVSLSDLLSAFPEGKASPKDAAYKTELPIKMGIRIPAQIGFAVKGYHLTACGRKMEGSLRVTSNIVSLCYLWNAIRVQGGAYGAGFPAGRDGSILCYSYRDPSPARSLQVYDTMADFIREFCGSDEDLDKFIISAVAATEPLRTPAEKGIVADEFWFSRVTDDDRIKNRRQMLSTDRNALMDWCSVLEQMAEEGAVCVVGHDEALGQCEGLTICEL